MCPLDKMATGLPDALDSSSFQDSVLRKEKCNETYLNLAHTLLTNDKRYAVCACGKILLVYSIKTAKCLRKLKGHDGKIVNFYLRKRYSTQVLSVDEFGAIFVWDYLQGTVVKSMHVKHPIKTVLQHPSNDDFIFIGKKELKNNNEKNATKHSLLRVDLTSSQKGKKKKSYLSCTSICPVPSSQKKIAVSYDGNFIAYLKKNSLNVYSVADKKERQYSMDGEKLVRITSHPSQLVVATGDTLGRIVLWREFFTDNAPITTVLHWHPHPLRSLSFSNDGLYLLSGGPEAVLVTWQLSSTKNDFLPRLGGTILHITLSDDDTLVAVTLSNNKVKIFSLGDKRLQCALQGSAEVSNVSLGIKEDPRTGCLVLPSVPPGLLQFYNAPEDSILMTVDITRQNYVVGPVGNAGYMSVVERFEFNHDGTWLVTLERGSYEVIPDEVKLKFWHYSLEIERYELVTIADAPHEDKVISLRVRPQPEVSTFDQMAVTTCADGKFKIWTFESLDVGGTMGSGEEAVSWKCQYSCLFGSWPCGKAAFSEDGSLLAVIYNKVITVWDSELGSLRTRFYCPVQDQRFRNVVFGAGSSAPYLLARTTHYLVCWNLLSCSMSWSVDLQVTCFAVDPLSGLLAVSATKSGSNSRVFLLDASTSRIAASLGKISSKIRSIVFSSVDKIEVKVDKGLCAIARPSILTVDKDIYTYVSLTEGDGIVENEDLVEEQFSTEFESIFQSSLPSKETGKAEEGVAAKGPLGNRSASLIRKVVGTPSHVLPPVGSLCAALLTAAISTDAESIAEPDEDQDSVGSEHEDDEEDDIEGKKEEKRPPADGNFLPKNANVDSRLSQLPGFKLKSRSFDFNWISEFVTQNYKS